MYCNIRFGYFLFLFFCACFAFSLPLCQEQALSYLNFETQKLLLKEKKFLEVAQKKKKAFYVPPFLKENLKEEIEQEIKKISPNVLVEALYLVPSSSRFNILYFYNSLLRVTSFKEVTYYNEEKKLTHPLFGFSYVVQDVQTKKELPDPQLLEPKYSMQLYVYQNFLPDSPSLMLYDYKSNCEDLFLKAVNLEPLTLRGCTAVAPQKLVLRLTLTQTNEGFIVYAIAYARVASFFGKGEKLFTYRIKGLFDWYYQKYLS